MREIGKEKDREQCVMCISSVDRRNLGVVGRLFFDPSRTFGLKWSIEIGGSPFGLAFLTRLAIFGVRIKYNKIGGMRACAERYSYHTVYAFIEPSGDSKKRKPIQEGGC